MLISYVNNVLGTQRKFLCVTRARRFGKSIAAKMLNAYYDHSVDSRALFYDLNVAHTPSFEANLNQYPVIYLDVTTFTTKHSVSIEDIVSVMNTELLADLQRAYPDILRMPADDLPDYLLTIVEHTHKPFIMIVDEWDAICREADNDMLMRQYVDWLRSMFKSGFTDRIFAGIYMTGILPIKQYNTQSALNNFEEFSMINPGPLAGCFGFTDDEVSALARKYAMDADIIKQWYDGYQIGDEYGIYNPYAVMRAMTRHSIEGYWSATSAYEGLSQYITMNFDGLYDAVVALLAGEAVAVDVMDFTNDIHDITGRNAVITLLIHLGYLSYDKSTATARIPNYEVRCEFERTIKETNWKNLAGIIRQSERFLRDTLAGNEQSVALALDAVHQDNTSVLQYNNENSLSCVITLAYMAARKAFYVHLQIFHHKNKNVYFCV